MAIERGAWPASRRRTSRRLWLGGLGLGAARGAGLALSRGAYLLAAVRARVGEPVEPAPLRPNPERTGPTVAIQAAWLGHSTVLLNFDGFRVLTDPVFSLRVGLSFGPLTLGLKRIVEPALRLEELPRVDLILLSHAHMDHFDIPSLRALESRSVQVVTARATSDLLRVDRYRRVVEVGWDETVQIGPVEIRGLRVKHWARGCEPTRGAGTTGTCYGAGTGG